jgi:hypothetical protein
MTQARSMPVAAQRELDSLPDEGNLTRNESFDSYVDHMSDSVQFEEPLQSIVEGATTVEAPKRCAPRDDQWSPKRSFLAESPYFSAFVEKEMHEIGLVTDILNDISNRTTSFTKYGALMAEATHSLSLSCRLRREEASHDDLRMTHHQMDVEIEKRRQALGPEMSDLLGIFGEVRPTSTNVRSDK